MLILFCTVALAVVIGICFTAYMSERARSLSLGIGAVVLAALVAAYYSVKPMLNRPDEPAQKFVAYFENASGIDTGDIVRIKGRRAGKVVGTEVVHRDGKVMIRVEFEIAPGSGSQWLKEGGIPVDSVIRVRPAPIVGRPSINIVYGDSDKFIPEGGEWTHVEGVSGEDRFEGWLRELRKFDVAIDKYMAYVNPELIARIKLNIAEIRVAIENARNGVERIVKAVPDINKGIEELSTTIMRLNADLRANGTQISKNLEKLNEQLKDAPAMAGDAQAAFAKLRTQIADFSQAISDNAARAESGDFGKALKEFRRTTAQLRAGAENAQADPKRVGDMPPWRLFRPYYNGGRSALESANTAEKGGASDYKELPPAPKPRPKPKT
jgi:ABC-type transporter Mla subunit MlaD